MKRILLISICTIATVLLQAQSLNIKALDSLFEALERNDKAMGSIAIGTEDSILYQKAIGWADIEAQIEATPDTKYRIGSVTKTFTAVLTLQQVEAGNLKLSTPLSKFFPAIPNADSITVEQLLRHQSGIFNMTNDFSYFTWMHQQTSRENLVEKIASYQSVFEPGSQSAYSNSNFVLLTFLLEDVSGKTYAQLLQESICTPCQLQSTYVGDTIASAKGEAYSYTMQESWKKGTETHMSIPRGAGAIVSTPSDLIRFHQCLFARKKLMEPELLADMKRIEKDYGMGLFELPFHNHQAIGHTGGIDAFISQAFHFPEADIYFAYCSNSSNYPINDIMIQILNIAFDMDYQIPNFKGYDVSAEELKPLLGTYRSETFPLELTFTRAGNQLIGTATGQSPIKLEAAAPNVFRFDPAGIQLKFQSDKETVILQQGGQTHQFQKKE